MIFVADSGGPSAADVELPPGVKFVPTDQELLGYYLYNHIEGKLPPHLYSTITRHDLYGVEEPWEVWKRLQSGGDPGDVYFFAELKKKVRAGGDEGRNYERKVGRSGGSWHGEDTGTKFALVRRRAAPAPPGNWVTGIRKRFNYRNPNPNFATERGKWILHEFSLSKDPAGRKDICGQVLCLLRNNGSPSASAVVEAARSSALASRKRDLQGYINYLAEKEKSDDSNKRRRFTPPPAEPQQPTASYSTHTHEKVTCSNPAPDSITEQSLNSIKRLRFTPPPPVHPQQPAAGYPTRDEKVSCSNPAPDSITEHSLDSDDVLSCIDFDSYINMAFAEDSRSVLGYGDFDMIKVEEQEQPLHLLPPPPSTQPAKPSVDDKGKKIMVAAGDDHGDQSFDTKEGILPPPCEMQGAGGNYDYDNYYYDYGIRTSQLEILPGFDGGGGFSDLLGMGLPFYYSWELQGNGSKGVL